MKDAFCFSFLRYTPCRILLFLAALPLALFSSFPALAVPPGPLYLPCAPASLPAGTDTDIPGSFVRDLYAFSADMAGRHGFDPQNLACILKQVRHNPAVIRLAGPAPAGKTRNWQAYRARIIRPGRITKGAQFWRQYKAALARAENAYGVPPEIIVGILGVETIYGRYKGNFRILDALATLAFDYPEHPRRDDRLSLFRKELENTLLLCAEQKMDPLALKGSYAGAVGWPQFLPSSIRRYAVDFDGNGKIDLENSPVDAIGSIAHFLAQHGWKKGEPAVFAATLSDTAGIFSLAGQGKSLAATLTPDALEKMGITPEKPLPGHLRFGLVDLQNGTGPTEYWLGTDNFFALTHYNRSYFYAMAVIDLGESVKTHLAQDRRTPARERRPARKKS
ncbi:MAG: lytic murein transglycosylase B [Oxalobacter formigenes]|nr:lytic murein transglycosylase B [Oxalobacter formigenes]MCM1280519.1 lytic murein transglycosylase B [Alistipes senegalensis]MCM1513081.1 lytic murein transglycosylase B [Oxalobacter formigenes]